MMMKLKGAVRDFVVVVVVAVVVVVVVQSPHCAENCLQHVRSRRQGSIERKSRATPRVLIWRSKPRATR